MSEGFVVLTRRLGPAFDLLAAYGGAGHFFFERNGVGVATSWEHGGLTSSVPRADPEGLRLLARRTIDMLRSLEHTGVGPRPVAVGALPFDPCHAATVAVGGRTVVRVREGAAWLIDLLPRGREPEQFTPGLTLGGEPHEAFDELQLRSSPSPGVYAASVSAAVQRIRAGQLRKVVLARRLEVGATRELDPARLLARLRAVDPECFVFAAPGGHEDPRSVLVGASPELLVARRGREVAAQPLAGSAPRFGDPERDEASRLALLSSAKDREEHAAVVDAVAAALEPLCARLGFPAEPDTIGTANVWHLATPFRGVLREPGTSVLELVAALHPTPAVCGTPHDSALAAIDEFEPFDRGSYGGPVGWMDAEGDGEWAIALRCAELCGETARLFAGAGIVADSVPELEVDETERKFRAFLDSLRWG